MPSAAERMCLHVGIGASAFFLAALLSLSISLVVLLVRPMSPNISFKQSHFVPTFEDNVIHPVNADGSTQSVETYLANEVQCSELTCTLETTAEWFQTIQAHFQYNHELADYLYGFRTSTSDEWFYAWSSLVPLCMFIPIVFLVAIPRHNKWNSNILLSLATLCFAVSILFFNMMYAEARVVDRSLAWYNPNELSELNRIASTATCTLATNEHISTAKCVAILPSGFVERASTVFATLYTVQHTLRQKETLVTIFDALFLTFMSLGIFGVMISIQLRLQKRHHRKKYRAVALSEDQAMDVEAPEEVNDDDDKDVQNESEHVASTNDLVMYEPMAYITSAPPADGEGVEMSPLS